MPRIRHAQRVRRTDGLPPWHQGSSSNRRLQQDRQVSCCILSCGMDVRPSASCQYVNISARESEPLKECPAARACRPVLLTTLSMPNRGQCLPNKSCQCVRFCTQIYQRFLARRDQNIRFGSMFVCLLETAQLRRQPLVRKANRARGLPGSKGMMGTRIAVRRAY